MVMAYLRLKKKKERKGDKPFKLIPSGVAGGKEEWAREVN
jgi:hypothetical protein